jgi:hypothetical protein
MTKKINWQDDEDIKHAGEALQRAARKARELAERTGTPFYVFRDGKIVDLIAEEKAKNRNGQSAKD